jgi:hypothetical protein
MTAPTTSYNVFDPITPSDSVDLPRPTLTSAIWVGGVGNVAAVMQNGVVVVFTAVPAGTWLPLAVRRINATNTTATLLVALYG